MADAARGGRAWATDFPGEVDRAVARGSAFPEEDRDTPWYGPWLVRRGGVVVGALGCKGPPRDGVVEIGYGIVPSARGRGVASGAVRLLLAHLDARGVAVVAETTTQNLPSQAVLRRVGFHEVARRHDESDGDLIVWRRPTPA